MPLRRRLSFEPLEARQMLAVDLAVVNVHFVDPTTFGSGPPTSTPVEGQRISLSADISMSGFAGGENYKIRFEINSVQQNIDFGSASAGQNSIHIWERNGWYAEPNTTHTVIVTVDPDDEIVETDETNNVFTFDFTPVAQTTLPQKFIHPVAGVESVDWITDGYFDVDPTSSFVDYRGNATHTRDTHNGIDFRIVNFAQADQGVNVVAAADGEVAFVQDGRFDRSTFYQFSPTFEGNRVFIDHGNGWVSQYYHLQRDSVTVSVGETVTAGQVLGRVGSSGNSFAPHLHFEVQHENLPVDPFVAPNDYFVDPPDYPYDTVPTLLDMGITTDAPDFRDVMELPSDNDALPASTTTIFPWVVLSSIEAGDTWELKIYDPSGAEYVQVGSPGPITFPSTIAGSWQWNNWWAVSLNNPVAGNWRAEVFVNGNSVGEEIFIVGRDLPEIRIIDDLNGNNIVECSPTNFVDCLEPAIIDGRRTPVDFGEVAQGSASPTKTFFVENHGFADLTISSVQVPTGFTITEPLDATLAPSSSDQFTIALDTTTVGPQSGTVQIISNDRAAADLDADGDVDGSNFLQWQRGAGITSGATVADGDVNGDGAVTADDLALWQLQYASSTETLFEFPVEGEVTAPLSATSALSIPAFDVALSDSSNSDEDERFVRLEESRESTVVQHVESALQAATATSDDQAADPLANDQQTKRKRASSRADSFFSLLGAVGVAGVERSEPPADSDLDF